VKFDGLFAFVYSDRPNAPAAKFSDKIADSLKKKRLQRVLNCQSDFTLAKHQAMIGTVQEVLVDGKSKHRNDAVAGNGTDGQFSRAQWSGRTSTNKIVHFVEEVKSPAENQMLTGQLMQIMIEEALPHCLWGCPTASNNRSDSASKGDKSYAA
jgi:tRNA-2-methylthio-N6-dimethylallyladenosine synthase